MIEIVEGLPDNVVAFVAKGQVSRCDYSEVLVPAVDEALRRHPKVRCYYELGPEFTGLDSGAVWEDFKVGVEHIAQWERVALVTDVEWIRLAVNTVRFLMPCDVRLYSTAQAADARIWIAGD
ncbi:STAS/SEC14 domain-containing protein [Xanthobacter aminoxidans]|uniref:STAS/SEC14 domain-containing protein n=1 Tax=Xanthobacter aminoxidans TaxID=186280 RepID=UPI003728E280